MNLRERLAGAAGDPDALLAGFLDWAADRGLELYPAQEEAILEVLADRHVVLNTPTGSGKSLVALAVHALAIGTGRRSYYTSPIKALVTEKFFELCRELGAESVGMLTGDAAINRDAPVVCCTAEVLSSLALSEGDRAGVDHAVMDEFHYYADRERGMAWQAPLLALRRARFLLMSATLGDVRDIAAVLEARTGRAVSIVRSSQRPVPLAFEYAETPLQETIAELVKKDRAPVYVVSFTHRDCAELAQSLTSLNLAPREDKQRLADALRGFRFDTPYGKDVERFLRHGIGIHHAGLLPKYRLLVERLAQQGLLKVIAGTDTLGVGINIPLRTVLFTRLCKFDGNKTRLLSVRDFQQIAGRAGRKGYDEAGWVVCQAPEHVIENKRLAEKALTDPKFRKVPKKKPPEKGYVAWDESTFRQLVERDPEPLSSRFRVDHGALLGLLQRPEGAGEVGYRALLDLIAASHEPPARKARLKREAAGLFRTLRRAGVVELVRRPQSALSSGRGSFVRLAADLPRDFSLHHTLSLFLLDALLRLDPEQPGHALRVLTLTEAILEDPVTVLLRQQDKLRREKLAELKAEGVEFDQRRDVLDRITWPMPDADLVAESFEAFAAHHPWVRVADVRPKSVARDMYERFASFNEYVREYGLQTAEGLLLRHLSQTYKLLVRTLPPSARTEGVHEAVAYLRSTLERTDASLVQAWSDLVGAGGLPPDAPPQAVEALGVPDLATDPRALRARVRAELHAVVKALAARDYEEAALAVRPDAEDPEGPWTAERLESALRPFYAEYDVLIFDHGARQPGNTRMDPIGAAGDRRWRVRQVLVDPVGDNLWHLDGEVDLRGAGPDPEGPLFRLERIGT